MEGIFINHYKGVLINMKRKVFAVLMSVVMLAAVCGQAFAESELNKPEPSKLVISTPVSADIVFFIDASGSMQEEITSVKENVVKFASELADKKVNARFAVIVFYDNYGTNYNIVQYIRIHTNSSGSHWLTAEGVRDALEGVQADGDETITLALKQVLPDQKIFVGNEGFREDAYHFGFLLTDEPAEYSPGIPNWYVNPNTYTPLSKLIEPLGKIMKMSVITGLDIKDYYRSLFMNTDGVFIDINRENYWRSMMDIAQWIVDTVVVGEAKLPYTTIEVVNVAITVLNRIAQEVKTEPDKINVMEEDNYGKFDPSLPREASEEDKKALDGGEFLTKVDTINLYSDELSKGEYGYFLFKLNLNIDSSVIGSGLPVGNTAPEDFEKEKDNAFIPFIMSDYTTGNKLDTIKTGNEKVLVLLYGKAEETLTLYLVKDKDGKVRLWTSGRETREVIPSDTENDDSGKGTITEEEADEKGVTSVDTDIKEGTKQLVDTTVELVKDWWDKYGEQVKDFVKKATGGGGCDAGLGLVGVLALAGLAFRKR